MARTKYIYNELACRYEPSRLKGKQLIKKMSTFIGLSLILALCGYAFYLRNFGTLEETLLERRNITLKAEWQILEERIERLYATLGELVDKDDNTYRVILDSSPLSPSIREAGVGGSEKLPNEIKNMPLLMQNYTAMLNLKHKVGIEIQSYQELRDLLDEKTSMWSSRPAIQPINNKQLDKLHLTYGSRFHPIFHVYKEHKGLDFTASKGTPVHATGDGKVLMTYFSDSYGNVIYIDHGFGYETRYAHLSGFATKPGMKVKRGEVVGYVGNTGTSVSPHLHYEVLYKGQHINPINFFQRDLSNHEYEKLIEVGSTQSAVLD